MCGIAGVFEYRTGKPADHDLVQRMTGILSHRGPDGEGYYYSRKGSLGFGHRRLAIIDLQTGDQPISNEDGTVWVSFNGEIYNYRELREQLKAKGHVFRTASDTEVIVLAYEEWGENSATKLNGIFAYSIWDEKKETLCLARDHFGVKPLYYYDDGSRLLFASEIKSILCDPSLPRSIDLDALNLCLTFRHTPSPWTLFKNIKKLPPGSILMLNSSGMKVCRYWDDALEIDRSRQKGEWINELEGLYEQAVERQMVSDVPIGLSLSSGVDSNTLLALMSRHSKGVHTFTVGFEGGEKRDYEVDLAVKSAKAFGAEYDTQVTKESDYFDFMQKYIWHLEEPIGNESAAAYYFVAKLARPKVKVLLSGQGADEPFAGYGRHLAARYAQLLQRVPRPVLKIVSSAISPLNRGSELPRRFLESFSGKGELDFLLSIYSITSPQLRQKLLNAESQRAIDQDLAREYIRSQLSRAPQGTLLERMAYIDARTSLPDNLLLCGDKMAMATSVEVRVPFLDLELMSVAEKIPGSMKVSWLKNKVIHKLVCERWLPKEQVHRRKIGFNNPMDRWLRQKLEVALNDLTSSPHSVARDFMNLNYIRDLQNQHKSGKQDYHRLLFLLLSIETWSNVFLKP